MFRSLLHPPDYQSRLDIVRANSKTSLDRTGSFLSTAGTLQVRYKQKLEFPQKVPDWLTEVSVMAFFFYLWLWPLNKLHCGDDIKKNPFFPFRVVFLIPVEAGGSISLISRAKVYTQRHPNHHSVWISTRHRMPVSSCISSHVSQFTPASSQWHCTDLVTTSLHSLSLNEEYYLISLKICPL